MQKLKDLIFITTIGGYILVMGAILVGGSTIFANSIFTNSTEGWNHFVFVFPFVLIGTGIWGIPLALINGTFLLSTDMLYRAIIFLAGATVSIPIIVLMSKGISVWRRVPYIYAICVLIAGTPIWLEPTFGR